MPLLEEIAADHDHWLGSYGSLVIVFWLTDMAPRACRRLPRVARDLAARQREPRVSVLSLSRPNSSPPSRETRKALAELGRDSAPWVARIAVVREGRGFVASTVASVTAGIHMLAGAGASHKTFSDVPEATRWATEPLRQFRTGRCTADGVLHVVERKRRFFAERA
jgi:hypothetical protein